MDRTTGCISVGIPQSDQLDVELVIEYMQPTDEGCIIWADIFLNNVTEEPQDAWLVHRGSLSAVNVSDSWLSDADSTFEHSLTERITRLHRRSRPITIAGRQVSIDGHHYDLWSGPSRIEPIVGDRSDIDVPFTMWKLGAFGPRSRHLIRVRLTMAQPTFDKEIGQDGQFYAYGDSILLDKIEQVDLPCFSGADRACYEETFKKFKEAFHAIPRVFEYLVIARENAPLGWYIAALSPSVSSQFIFDSDIQLSTRWLISEQPEWSAMGKRVNAFVIGVSAHPAIAYA